MDQYVGKEICLKGYALWAGSSEASQQFLLSPNGNEIRKEAVVLVELNPGQMWDWRPDALAVSGTLVPNPQAKTDAAAPKFVLQDPTVRLSCTRYDLADLVPGKGC